MNNIIYIWFRRRFFGMQDFIKIKMIFEKKRINFVGNEMQIWIYIIECRDVLYMFNFHIRQLIYVFFFYILVFV